jgi:hypothetical protein
MDVASIKAHHRQIMSGHHTRTLLKKGFTGKIIQEFIDIVQNLQ